MVLRTWRVYARLDDYKNPIEFSYVSCLLEETPNFVLWELVRGTHDDALRAAVKNRKIFLKENYEHSEVR